MVKKQQPIPWYKPGPEFHVSDAFKKFVLDLFLTFIAGGLLTLINAIESGAIEVPLELVAYTGLILAVLHTIYTLVDNYKNGV